MFHSKVEKNGRKVWSRKELRNKCFEAEQFEKRAEGKVS